MKTKNSPMQAIKILVLALLVLLALMSIAGTGQTAGQAPSLDGEQIDEFVSQQMQRHNLPGLALAVVDGDRVIFAKGYGRAGDSGQEITPQTPFLLASVSKPLTAAAVMQLVETGQIELDAPVQRYLPEFRLADPAATAQITVRQLLLHTSGLPATACDTRKNAQTLAEYVAELQSVRLAAPVGARHIYCSGNYNVLGRIIEVVSGQPFGRYMQAHVFAPLAMQHSFTSQEQAQQAGLAKGYRWFFGLPLSTRARYNPSQLPSGMMIASAEDLGHFLIAQLNGGRYAGSRLLSPESIAAMQAPGVARGGGGSYGLGWVIAPVGGEPAIWHDGVGVNTHTLLLIQPQTRRGAVLLFNSFGIVAYASAYPEIEAGMAGLLAGQAPSAEAGPSLGRLYGLIDLILAAGLALAAWPLVRLGRWQRQRIDARGTRSRSIGRDLLRPAVEVGAGAALLSVVRVFLGAGLGAQSWGEALEAFPDFVAWVWAVGLLVLLTGAGRAGLVLRARRTAQRLNTAAGENRL